MDKALKMTIELHKDDERFGTGNWILNRGGFNVFVGGFHWGKLKMATHGCHGASYRLFQRHGDAFPTATVEVELSEKSYLRRGGRTTKTQDFVCWSDKHYLNYEFPEHRKKHPNAQPVKLADRLKAMVADAIERGGLHNPESVAADARKTNDRMAAARKSANEKKRRAWEAKARSALGNTIIGGDTRARVVAKIVDLMKWAQTQ